MTIVELMDNLAEFLKPAVKDYSTKQKAGTVPVNVYAGFPPVRTKAAEKESFIYVLVLSSTDASDNNASTAKVEIGFSIFDEDKTDGWRSLYNLMEHIRQYLLKYRIALERARLELPLKTEIVDDQPFPQWQGKITADYTIWQPYEEGINYDDIQEIRTKI